MTVVLATVRIHVIVRAITGDVIKSWSKVKPYLRLGELRIPGRRSEDKVVKQAKVMQDFDPLWVDGEDLAVELTLVKTTSPTSDSAPALRVR